MADFPGWDKAVASAKKALGADAKIPQPRPAIVKAADAEQKAWDDFAKARETLEDQILDLVDKSQALVDAAQQFRDSLSDEDFSLDAKKDAKKIADGKKALMVPVDGMIATAKTNAKNERDLNKHLAHIRSYKQQKS